jgi:hypothetical protein
MATNTKALQIALVEHGTTLIDWFYVVNDLRLLGIACIEAHNAQRIGAAIKPAYPAPLARTVDRVARTAS